MLQPIQNHVEMGMTLTELESKIASINFYPALFSKAFGSSLIDSNRIARALAQFVRSIVTYQSNPAITCGGCHTPPMFITSQPHAPFGLIDPNDRGINNQNRFKSPSLRNIDNSAPYFHNGSVATLDAVISTGIPAHGIPPPDRPKILAFLKTLTDNSFVTDPKYADPFK